MACGGGRSFDVGDVTELKCSRVEEFKSSRVEELKSSRVEEFKLID